MLKAEKPYLLPASGSDQYWNFVLRVPIDKTRWVKAVEIRPADKRLVHHANMLVDRTQSARHMESEPGAGFGGMEISLESEAFDPDSHFLFWKPGSFPYVRARRTRPATKSGTDLILNSPSAFRKTRAHPAQRGPLFHRQGRDQVSHAVTAPE